MADEAKTSGASGDKPKRVSRPIKPRPAYILLSAPLPDDIKILGVTRKAEEALEAVDPLVDNEVAAYMRIVIK